MNRIGLQHHDTRGRLVAYEFKDFDFEPKRIYTIDKVPSDEKRGGHAHKQLHQYIVALKGSFDLRIRRPAGMWEEFKVSSPEQGIRIKPYTWRELLNFSENAICLVFASEEFCKDDYIWSLEELDKHAKSGY